MFILSPLFYTLSWTIFLLSLSYSFFIIFIFHLFHVSSISFSLTLFPLSFSTFTLSVTSDIYSSSFSSVVCLISAVVFIFSDYYFSSFYKHKYFLWVTFLFVASMLILINFSDIFFVMLGWDGLGIVSFFLILFYQSSVSLYSSIFTLLMNRLGDCFFVVLIVIVSMHSFSNFFTFLDFDGSSYIALLFLVTFITNSALFPFSPWLPAAIAAPTPISSLVHSSTLVTAGLFLIIRNFVYISSSAGALYLLSVVGLFTSFYAGLSSLVESDLNKVVALSTLSHLGFISFSLGLNCPNLAFLHLIAHALFKSSLFISLGSLISQYYHYQDSRLFSSLFTYNPFFSSVIVISSSSLLGLPFLSGFYSKDLILESFSSLGLALTFVIYFNLFFTFSYTLRLTFSLSLSSYMPSYVISPRKSFTFSIFLFFLSALSICFGLVASKVLLYSSFYLPLLLNFLPYLLLFSILLVSYVYLLSTSHNFYSLLLIKPIKFISDIVYLSPLWGSSLPSGILNVGHTLNRTLEYGGLYVMLVSGPYALFMSVSRLALTYYISSNSLKFILILVPFVLLSFVFVV